MNQFEKLKPKHEPEQGTIESLERLLPRIEYVESENARYRIVGSVHIFANTIEQLGNPDAVALETGKIHGDPEQIVERLEHHPQYRIIIPELKERGLPIYFVDIHFQPLVQEVIDKPSEKDIMAHSGKKIIPGGLGLAYLVKKVIEFEHSKKPMSRREFLKVAGVGGMTLALLSPLSNPLFDALESCFNPELGTEKKVKKEYRNPRASNELLLTFRNIVIAEKLEHIARTMKLNLKEKPDITIFVGSSHISEKDEMSLNNLLKLKESPQFNRVRLLHKFLERPYFSKHVADPKDITRVVSVRYSQDSGKWQTETTYNDYMLGGGRG